MSLVEKEVPEWLACVVGLIVAPVIIAAMWFVFVWVNS